MLHEVVSDGKTVWVNDEASCIGRFSKFGIDIHKSLDEQIRTGDQCLDCTHSLPTQEDWLRFKSGMLTHFGIVVNDTHKPHFLEST